MSNLAVFEFEKNVIRFVKIDGVPHAVGIDVARVLGYANPSDALYKKVNPDYTRLCKLYMQNQNRDVTCISEAGIYQLIFGSKLESAKIFQRWVFEEVLPQIRQTISYSHQLKTLTELSMKHKIISRKKGYVYLIKNNNTSNLKIGYSTNPLNRLQTLLSTTDCDLVLITYYEGTIADEQMLHRDFLHLYIKNEWFKHSDEIYSHFLSKTNKKTLDSPSTT